MYKDTCCIWKLITIGLVGAGLLMLIGWTGYAAKRNRRVTGLEAAVVRILGDSAAKLLWFVAYTAILALIVFVLWTVGRLVVKVVQYAWS